MFEFDSSWDCVSFYVSVCLCLFDFSSRMFMILFYLDFDNINNGGLVVKDMVGDNVVLFLISEILVLFKCMVEDCFGFVCVCGEFLGVKCVVLGYLYFCLKDEGVCFDGVMWKGNVGCLFFCFEDGIEVIVIGKFIIYFGCLNY